MYIRIKTSAAIKYAGNKSKLAMLLEITRQSLTSWGEYLPQTSAQKLFILTQGEIGDKVDENLNGTVRVILNKEPNQNSTPNPTMFYP